MSTYAYPPGSSNWTCFQIGQESPERSLSLLVTALEFPKKLAKVSTLVGDGCLFFSQKFKSLSPSFLFCFVFVLPLLPIVPLPLSFPIPLLLRFLWWLIFSTLTPLCTREWLSLDVSFLTFTRLLGFVGWQFSPIPGNFQPFYLFVCLFFKKCNCLQSSYCPWLQPLEKCQSYVC